MMCRATQVFFIGVMFVSLSSGQDASTDWIGKATESYQQALDTLDRNDRIRKFREAQSLYESAVADLSSQGIRNAELYVNLGNASLASEQTGKAILAYRRAITIDANHNRAKQNLEHARTLLPSWVPKPEDSIALGSFFDWARHLSDADWQGVIALMFLIGAVLLAIAIRLESRAARNFGIGLLALWAILFVWLFAFAVSDESELAVVVVPETVARSADSIHSPSRLPDPLPGGSEVEIVEDRGDWLRVRLFDGREVWLSASAIEAISGSN